MKWESIKITIALISIFASSPLMASEEEKEVAEKITTLLVVGKMTGNCGIFDLQLSFLESTELEGGANFFARFWNYEAARLGMTLEEYTEQCVKHTQTYREQYELFDSFQ